MTNDTTTLNGALSELGEILAANLTTKGVTASANDGLTTLANKVLQISGSEDNNSNCITFSFDDDSVFCDNIPSDKAYFLEDQNGSTDYIDSEINPSAEPHYDDLTIYCCNLADVEDVIEIIQIYNLVSEYYANDPNGLVQLIGTLQYPDGTLTYNCSNNSPIIFEDDCDNQNGLVNYGTPIIVRGSGNAELAYNNNGYYTTTITNTTAMQVLYPINILNGATNLYKFTVELYPQSGTNCGGGLCIFNDTSNFFALYTNYQSKIYETSQLNGSEIDTSRGNVTTMNVWQKYEFIIDEGIVTLNVYDSNDNKILTTSTNLRITIGSSTKIGITQTWQNNNVVRIRNIKVESKEAVPCFEYIQDIANAITYINGSGS